MAVQPAHHKKDWPEKVLAACREIPNVVRAAKEVGVSRRQIYAKRSTDQDFAAELKDALTEGVEACEAEAHRRAFEGISVPKTIAGEREEVTEYSDTLLIFLMKAHKPQKYRDHYSVEHKGSISRPVEVAGLDKIMEQWMGRNGRSKLDSAADATDDA